MNVQVTFIVIGFCGARLILAKRSHTTDLTETYLLRWEHRIVKALVDVATDIMTRLYAIDPHVAIRHMESAHSRSREKIPVGGSP
jgi:hypothetical protein